MPLEADLKKLLLESMRAKDLRTADVIRMINTKIMERRTAKGFSGEVDDAMVTEVIAAYRKSLVKGREEFAAVGERGKEQVESLTWEIALCERFLPQSLSVDELRAAVVAAIAATGAKDGPDPKKMAGKVVGEVMKHHKGRVEPGEAKKVADEELAKLT
jgi:uncharacterized protein YqeY